MKRILLFVFLIAKISLFAQTQPTGTTSTLSTNEDTDRIFSAADFGYNDADGDPFTSIEIFNNVTVGTLYIDANGNSVVDGPEVVAVNDVIDVATVINANQLKFKPVANANGNNYDNFLFYVNDGNDGNSTLNNTITIDVNAVNDTPVLSTNTGATLNEGATHTIVQAELEATDIEEAANQLTFTVNAIPSNGTLYLNAGALIVNDTYTQDDINNNRITYTHDGGETIADAFTITVDDGNGGSTVATAFNLTITAVNDAPVLVNNAGVSVNEGTSNNIIPNTALLVSDVDNTTAQITYTLSSVTTNGTLYNNAVALIAGGTFTQQDIDNNLLTYNHDGTETLADNFQFTIADGAGGNIGATTFNITVNAVNDDPVVTTNTGKTVNEASAGNTILISELETTDNDNTPAQLSYTLTVVPVNGSLYNGGPALIVGNTFTQNDINSNNITYDHDGSETLSDSFTFTVDDGAGGSAPATVFNLTITAVNDVPVIVNNIGTTVNEGSMNNIIPNTALQVTDADNTAAQITYTISTATTNGTLYNNAAALGVGGNFTQQDIDNNLLTYSHDGTETLSDNFQFSVADGAGGNIGATTFNITVNAVNDDPVVTTNTGKTVNEASAGNTILISELETTDNDNTPAQLTYTVTAVPVNGTIRNGGVALINGNTFTQNDINSNNLTYDHDGSETLSDSFTFTLVDGAGGSAPATVFNLTITAVNDVPVIVNNLGTTVNEGSTNNIIPNTALQVTDADNTAAQITYTISTATANGTLYNNAVALGVGGNFTQQDIDNNLLTYSHDGTETLSDNFQFSVTDGAGGNIGATTFNITVNAVNDDPVVTTNTGKTVNEASAGNTILVSELETSDPDNTPAQLTYTVTVVPVNGTLRNGGVALVNGNTFTQNDINSSNITYDHDGSETLSDSFTFTLADGAGGSAAATVFNLTVTAVNDAPVLATNIGTTVNEGAVGNVIPNTALQVTDVDNTAMQITYTVSAVPTNGTLYNNAVALAITDNFTQDDIDNNRLTYDHDGSETLADNFQFTVTDGAGGNIGVSTFNITVNAVNDDPVFTSTPITVGKETILYTYDVTATDADNALGFANFALTTGPGWITLNNVGPGLAQLSGTPPIGGSYAITMTCNDGSGGITQQIFTIIVSDAWVVDGLGGADFVTVQAAINAAANTDIIYIQAGTFNENINFNGKQIEIIGAGTGTTIIDGGGNGSVVTFESGENNNSIIRDLTIQNGGGNFRSLGNEINPVAYYGGGIFCSGASPVLENLVITNNFLPIHNNHLGGSGGGIYLGNGSDAQINNVEVSNNTASRYRGGGICIDNSNPTIQNTQILNNTTGNYGGGISAWQSNFTLNTVLIQGNTANGPNGMGGGIFTINCTPSLTAVTNNTNNATISGNDTYNH